MIKEQHDSALTPVDKAKYLHVKTALMLGMFVLARK